MKGAELSGRAEALIRRAVEAGRIPFGAFGVWKCGEPVAASFSGLADREAGLAAGPETLVRLYSMTKPVTAVAAMALCDRGLLNESDPVSKYLPEYARLTALDEAGREVRCDREMLVRDLLNMTAGMVYPGPDAVGMRMQAMFDQQRRAIREGRGWTARQVAREIARRPLAFQPGAHWRYGLEADALGAVVEAASGRALGAFLREEIFAPLDMKDTAFCAPEDARGRLAQLYKRVDGRLEIDPDRHIGLTLGLTPPAFESGGAGLISTFNDYARFGRMLAGYGQLDGVRILREETVRSFEADQLNEGQRATLAFAASPGFGYGHLMRVCVDPSWATAPADQGEFGWDGWTGVYMAVSPRRNLFTLYLTQVSEGVDPDMTDALRALVYDWLQEEEK